MRLPIQWVIAFLVLVGGSVWLVRPLAQEAETTARHRQRGKAFYEQGDYEAAVAELGRVVTSESAAARDYFNLGMAHLQNGDSENALAAFTTAGQMDPHLIEIDFGLGILYKRQGRYPMALEHLERVAARDPQDPGTWFNIGVVLHSLERFERAEQAFQRVLAMGHARAQNFYVSALFRRATLLARRGHREEAQRWFEEFRRLREAMPSVALTPSALENGEYGAVEVDVVPEEAPRPPSPPAPFSLGQELRVGSACESGTPILAPGEVDGDGRIDVFLCSPCGENRLLRNRDGDRLEDVTERVNLDDSPACLSAVFADVDNSGRPSLVVLGPRGLRLYRNREGRFEEARGTGLPSGRWGSAPSALSFDFDNDGQLDWFFTGGNELGLYRNNGDGTFQDVTAEAGLGVYAETIARGMAFADFGEDGFPDLLVATAGGEVLWLVNEGTPLFRGRTLSLPGIADIDSSGRIEVADLDHDGWLDALVLLRGGYALLRNREGALEPVPSPAPESSLPRSVALDADADGWLDVLSHEAKQGTEVSFNRGRWRFEPQRTTSVLEIAPASDVVAIDLEGNGRTVLLEARRDGTLRLYERPRPPGTSWLRVALEGTRTNRQAVGALVEVKAGRFYQKHLATGLPLTVYVGDRRTMDVMRVTWPNGIVQNVVDVETDRVLRLTETERQASSCPFLYVWNGEAYQFLTDIVGRAPLGELLPGGGRVVPNPEDYVRVPPGAMVEREGRYVFQLTEELREQAYLDAVELRVIDHPEGTEIYTNEKFTAPPFEPFELYMVSQRHPPAEATDERGRDILSEVVRRDGRYWEGGTPRPVSGFAEEHSLVLDPGNLRGPLWLFLTGWVYWPSSSSMKAVSSRRDFSPLPPKLDVRGPEGRWVTAIPELGLPSGINRTLAVELTGTFLSDDRRVRITTNFRVSWDEAFFATGIDGPLTEHRPLKPQAADLHYRGFSALVRDEDSSRPEHFDYQRTVWPPPWNPAPGLYTRYGDVTGLLEHADDELVILAPGDEMTVSFDAASLPPPPRGWTRDFVLHVTGWAKDQDPHTLFSRTVPPHPYRAMSSYAEAARRKAERSPYITRRAPSLIPPLRPPRPPAQ